MRIHLSAPLHVAGTALLLVLTGCASIVTGTTQSLAVETRSPSGKEIAGANCRLVSSKGTWFVTTPGSVTVHRATASPLSVNCTKEGHQQVGVTSIKPKSKGMTWGNLLFGGVIGVVTDGITGAAGYYPSPITAIMEVVANAISPSSSDTATAESQPQVTPPPDAAQPAGPDPTATQQPPVINRRTSNWRDWGSKKN